MLNEPLYIQMILDMQEKIKSGVYPSDSFIPSESELQQIYNMSRTTVRRAISELVSNGYLTVMKGVGTKVMPSRLNTRVQELMSFTQLMRKLGMEPGTQDLRVEKIKPSPEIQKALETSDEVVKITRLRTADGTPISFNTSYIPAALLRNEDLSLFAEALSLYDALEKKLGIRVEITEDTYGAIQAGAAHAKQLGIRKNDPLLRIERTAFDQNNRIVEYSIIYIRADRYRHTVTLRVK